MLLINIGQSIRPTRLTYTTITTTVVVVGPVEVVEGAVEEVEVSVSQAFSP